MPQACLICGRESRGLVHDGHCHDVYYGRLTTQRRKFQQIDTQEVKQLLATATMVRAYREAEEMFGNLETTK